MSRTAVFARIVAIPSRRLSCSARWASLLVSSALTRARSSRTSSATTWNFVRTVGRHPAPLRRAASTSRTARASTEMTSPLTLPLTLPLTSMLCVLLCFVHIAIDIAIHMHHDVAVDMAADADAIDSPAPRGGPASPHVGLAWSTH